MSSECHTQSSKRSWRASNRTIGFLSPGSGKPSATGKVTPVELFVLGVLKVLGRGYFFDDLSGPTGVSREAHRVFFHMYDTSFFLNHYRTIFYCVFIK